jgi:hypothetical protein
VNQFLKVDQVDIGVSSLNSNKSSNRRILHYKYNNPKTIGEQFKKVGLIIKNYVNSDFIDSIPLLTEATKNIVLKSLTDDLQVIEKLTARNFSNWLI